jgi:surface antigen
MNIKFFSGLVAVTVIATVCVFSSCVKDEVVPTPVVVESIVPNEEGVTTRTTSAYITVTISPSEALKGTSFTFTMTGPTSTLTASGVVVYIRFTAPSGQLIYQQMTATGTSGSNTIYSHMRNLSQYGKYYVAFGYRLNNGSFQVFDDTRSAVVLHAEISQVDDYPYPDGSSSSTDAWGFVKYYCTSWVAWSVNKMWETSNAFHNTTMGVHLGNASNWKSALMSIGYEADNSPRVGDIAWWNSNHVAFVNKVQSNGTITITEYNGLNPLAYGSRTVSTSQNYPASFIHVQTKRE